MWKKLRERVREYRPDFLICLGDLLEASAPSVHNTDEDKIPALIEQRDARDALRELREDGGNDCKYVWIHGNHDDNWLRKDARRVPKEYRSLVDWRSSEFSPLHEEAKLWQQVAYSHRQIYRLGPVTFRHGADAGKTADEDGAVLYGVESGLTVSGHTHRGRDVQRVMWKPTVPTRYWFANAGCLVNWDLLEYMQRKRYATWTHGVVTGEISRAAVDENRARFSTPQWDARYELWQSGWD